MIRNASPQRSMLAATLPAVLASLALIAVSQPAHAAPIQPHQDPFDNVTWGPADPNVRPIKDKVFSGGLVTFYWTDGTKNAEGGLNKHPGYASFSQANDTTKPVTYTFIAPDDPSVKDWHQTVKYDPGSGGSSDVSSGAIQRFAQSRTNAASAGIEWSFFSLDELPDIPYEVPDFAGSAGQIYTAVDLLTYMTNNPLGPNNGQYAIGDSLDAMGLSIVNGRIPGVLGMYFATTPFTFDPNSTTGYVPLGGDSAWLNSAAYEGRGASSLTAAAGATIALNGIHDATGTATPEPSTLSFAAAGIVLVALGARRKKREPVRVLRRRHSCIL